MLVKTAGTDPSAGTPIAIDSRQRHYLLRVLRLGRGAAVELFDGQGRRWKALLEGHDEDTHLIVGARVPGTTASALDIRLGQCLSSAERMDWTLEKAVELGVRTITPLQSARSQIRLDASRASRKLEHWRAIAEAACMQSGRDDIPDVQPVTSIASWLTTSSDALRLVLSPEAQTSLSTVARERLSKDQPLQLLVGPESGLAESELDLAQQAGYIAVRLGPRVLRTETAGLAAIAALQALAGDF